MNRFFSFAIATIAIALIIVSCRHNEPVDNALEPVTVNLTVGYETSVEIAPAMIPTRAAATGVSRLVLSIFDAEGHVVTLQEGDSPITQLKQTAGDANFGTFTGIRLTPGTYRFVCVGHKCGSATTGHATITSPTSVTLPDPGVYTTYSLVKEVTISASSTMKQDVTMQLVNSYSMVNVISKDNIPSGTSKVRLTLNPTGTETTTYTFNPTTHLTTSNIKTVTTYDISTKVGKTQGFDMKFLLPANPQHYTLLVETLDASNNVLTTRTYDKDQSNNDILYYLGRTTKINTYLFSAGTTTTVTLEDWGADNTYDID